MKSTDEIKKGLECCKNYQDCNQHGIPRCSYYEMIDCASALCGDALAYIQQLEAERDAAVNEIKKMADCMQCKHNDLCKVMFPNCVKCEKTDCPCHTCAEWRNWQWLGVQKEE